MINLTSFKTMLAGVSLIAVLAFSGTAFAARSNARLISLSEAEKPDISDPLSAAADQIAELKKLQPIVENLESAIEVHNVLNKLRGFRDSQRAYNDMVRLHNKSIDILKQSEQCTIDFLGRYFENPIKLWSGLDLRSHPQDHEQRKGLSAWAINSFEVAKSGQLSPISGDDINSIGVISINDDLSREKTQDEILAEKGTKKMSDNAEMIEEKKKESTDLIQSRKGVFFKEPSKQDEYERDARKTNLIPSDIGAAASLMLAQTPQKWGTLKKKFPIWNDNKSFYDQYLDSKYYNIEEFINKAEITASVKAKISAALLEDQRKLMSKAEYDINLAALAAINKTNAQFDADYKNLLQKFSAEIAAAESAAKSATASVNSKFNEDSAAVNQKLKDLYAERDAYSKDINDTGTTISAFQDSIREYENNLAILESELNADGVTDDDKERFSKEKDSYSAQIDDAKDEIARLQTEKENLEKKYNELSDAIDSELANLNQLENQKTIDVADIKNKCETQKKVFSDSEKDEIAKLTKARDDKIDKINKASIAAKAALQANSSVTVQDIINTTSLVIEIGKADAIENIEKTRLAIAGLGDDLYRGTNHPAVVGYHKALVKSLKGEDAEFNGLKLPAVAGKVRGIKTDLTGIVSGWILNESLREMFVDLKSQYIKNENVIINVKLFDELLENADDSADTQFFVGSEGKIKDFRAPIAMMDFNLPPFREYVRFDATDLENITKGADMIEIGRSEDVKIGKMVIGSRFVSEGKRTMIDKEKFLSYGAQIPEIWKMMLKDKAFVESDFYLDASLAPEGRKVNKNVLKLGGETAALYRGGIYPCVLSNIKTQEKTPQVCEADGLISKGKAVVDVVIKSKGDEYSVGLGLVTGEKRNALLAQNLPTCKEVSASCSVKTKFSGGRLKKTSTPYLGFNDSDGDKLQNNNGNITEGDYSELGTILSVGSGRIGKKIVKGVLTLSEDMQSIQNYAQRIYEANQKQQDTSMKGEARQKDDIFSRAPMIDNQIGDFLQKVESEQSYKQSMEELKLAVDEMKADLLETLQSVGFQPSKDFDISKDEDYNLARNKLKSIKTNRVDVAAQGVDSIEAFGSELLKDSKSAYQKIVDALRTDKEAVTPMSTNVYDSYSLEEEVKTGEVNQKVDDTYQKTADQSIEEQLKAFGYPYCAAY